MTKILVQKGNLKVLEWAHQYGILNNEICSIASELGQLNVLKWACDYGYYSDESISIDAIRGKHLHIVKWLVSNSMALHPDLCTEAIEEYGDLELLKYLHENGCDWDEETCIAAASYGYLSILKYLRKMDVNVIMILQYLQPVIDTMLFMTGLLQMDVHKNINIKIIQNYKLKFTKNIFMHIITK
jgi:hypothetical protein